MRILTLPEAEVPGELKLQVAALQHQAWPDPAGPTAAPVHDPALHPLSLLLLDGDRVVAALDILSKPLHHAGRTYAASGLSAVVTDRAVRGRGHGHHLVTAARTTIERSGADLAIFTCDRELLPFYERAGFSLLPGTTLIGGTPEAPFPSDQEGFDKLTVATFLTPQARHHRPDFLHTRIALHPGEIDKLW
ncbi:GNAT family N-acetyltransferase [Kitasatospora sp. NPDC093806]|uniref:GNAT family N-acetyltransferase n=1 Tax=Kitasatospora sp. NPDC093806 TaxID=3155075 RepID=UPI003424038B